MNCFLERWFLTRRPPIDEYYNLAVSKDDLKPSGVISPKTLGFAASLKAAIYNIGTEILYFQCFVTTDMFLFSKSIIPEDSKILDRDLEHVLWNSAILSDPSENLHAALDWEVTFLRCGAVPTKTAKRDKNQNYQKLGLGLNFKKYNSSFAPASQQIIKILIKGGKEKIRDLSSSSIYFERESPGPAGPDRTGPVSGAGAEIKTGRD